MFTAANTIESFRHLSSGTRNPKQIVVDACQSTMEVTLPSISQIILTERAGW
jgi:hypothetical protein